MARKTLQYQGGGGMNPGASLDMVSKLLTIDMQKSQHEMEKELLPLRKKAMEAELENAYASARANKLTYDEKRNEINEKKFNSILDVKKLLQDVLKMNFI
jgi:hypothetical protein